MNYARLVLLGCLLCPFFMLAQQFVPSQLDTDQLEDQFLALVNDYRVERGWPILIKNAVLSLAANDQVRYIKAVKKLTHDQLFTGKETAQNRVNSHNGVFQGIVENLAFVPFQLDYPTQAQAIFAAFKNKPEYWKNLSNPLFKFSGLRFANDNPANGMYVVQVLAGQAFDGLAGVEIIEDAHQIEAFEAAACQRVTNNPYIAADLPLHLRLFGSSIYLEYHDKAVLQEIIAQPGDALAIDIIHRDQFRCEEENNFYPSEVHDGAMLQPIPYEALYQSNQHPDSNRLYTYLGKIPEVLKKEAIQLNVIAINQDKACVNNYPIGIPFGNLPLFRINPIWALETLKGVDPVQIAAVGYLDPNLEKVTHLEEKLVLQFDKSSIQFADDQWEKVHQFVSAQLPQIDSIQVLAYSSVEGNTAGNLVLQQQRADTIKQALLSLGLAPHKISATAAENWPLFYQQILGTAWSKFEKLAQSTIKQQLENPQTAQQLAPQLAAQREAKVIIYYRQERNEAFTPYQLAKSTPQALAMLKDLQAAINSEQTTKALELQADLIRAFLAFDLNLSDITNIHIPLRKSNIALLSNALALDLFFKKHIRTDQEYLDKVKAIYELAPNYFPLQFNYLGFAVRYFYQKKQPLDATANLSEKILQLYEHDSYQIEYQAIDKALDRLMINFHLAAVDYHFQQRDYDQRTASMLAIQDYFSEKEMSEAEVLALTRFFNRNYYLDWSIATMQPYLEEENASDNLFFTYLQTYTFWKEGKREKAYYELMNTCLERNKARLCKWLSTYFQLQREENTQTLFCEYCR